MLSGASFRLSLSAVVYFKAASVIACVRAPSGAADITGSEPPDSNVITVRSKSATSTAPPDCNVALLHAFLESIARIKATLFWDGANAGKQQTESFHPKR